MSKHRPTIASALAATSLMIGCETAGLQATFGGQVASVHSELPVEIYSRIARGALNCWFGPQGSLKKTHIFHADVAPEPAGGGAEIVVHERDNSAENPRSFRAYRVAIEKLAGGSSVRAENLRMPAYVAKDMDADVRRWSMGQADCSTVGTGGWGQQPNLVPADAAQQAAKKKK